MVRRQNAKLIVMAVELVMRSRAMRVIALMAAIFVAADILLGYAANPAPKFFVNEKTTPQVTNLLAQKNAVPAIIIYDHYGIDINNDGLFDKSAMDAAVKDLVPLNYSGPVCLDWEGLGMAYLVLPTTPFLFERTKQEFIAAAQYFKSLRPNAKVGFYGLPRTVYFDRGPEWIALADKLQPILDKCDCLFPSVYSFYALGDNGYTASDDHQFVRDAVWIALRGAHGKPVYPYVWPRYHDSNPVHGYALVPASHLQARTTQVFNITYQGHRAAGLVWWGVDQYFLNLSRMNLPPSDPMYAHSQRLKVVFAQEWKNNETDQQHFTRIHKNTLFQLAAAIQDAP